MKIRETAADSLRAVKTRASTVVATVNTTVTSTIDRVQSQAGARRESLTAVVAQIQAVLSEKLAPMKPHVEKVRAEATQEVCKVRDAGKAVGQEARELAAGLRLRVSRYLAPAAAATDAPAETAPAAAVAPAAKDTAA